MKTRWSQRVIAILAVTTFSACATWSRGPATATPPSQVVKPSPSEPVVKIGPVVEMSSGPKSNRAKDSFSLANLKKTEGDYAGADLEFAQAIALEPNYANAHYQRACNFALWNKREEAFDSLDSAIDSGFWGYPVAVSDSDLNSLRSDPRLEAILKRIEGLYRAHLRAPLPGPLMAKPAKLKQETPLVIFLHGWADSPSSYTEELLAWAKLGYVAIAPAAPEPLMDDSYSWPADDLETTKIYLDSILAATQLQSLENRKIYIAGFSQGGAYSARLLLEYPENFAGAVCVSPGGWQSPDLSTAGPSSRRMYLVYGRQDFPQVLALSKSLIELWHQRQWPLKLSVHEGEHRFPDNWSEERLDVSRFLVDEQKGVPDSSPR